MKAHRFFAPVSIALTFFAGVAAVAGVAGCNTDLGQVSTGLQAIQITNYAPSNLGDIMNPVSFSDVSFDLTAIGPDGNLLAQDLDVNIYVIYSGIKIGLITDCGGGEDAMPLATAHLTAGKAANVMVHLVKAYGSATVWIEDPISHAVGASDPMYFAQPTIPDVQTPLDLTSPTATYCSPWNGRVIDVDHATGTGQLMVTSLFGGAYVVTDTGAMYDPTTMMGGYNNMYVFSFGQPPSAIQNGLVMTTFSGNVAKFNGFTELNFPLQTWQTDMSGAPVYGKVPPPYVLQPTDEGNNALLLKLAGGVVQVTGRVCPITLTPVPDPQWVKFNTFTVDIGNGVCDSFLGLSVALPAKTLGDFNPLVSDMTLAQFTFTGMLQNSSGQNDACKGSGPLVYCATSNDCSAGASDPMYSATCQIALAKAACIEGTCRRGVFNFWSIIPRSPDDVVAQP